MSIHYLGDIKYVSGKTKNGLYRSPLREISYNSGQELKDYETGRTHNRPHTDGTIIIDNGIVSADPGCEYGNTSVSSKTRREKLYYTLYCMNKNKAERIYAHTVIALSNQFSDEQLQVVAKAIGISFSRKFGRPFDYAIHKKPATLKKPANNHMHVAWPMRTYENGKFNEQKSVSYYVNMDGSINYEKKYKDENGLDVRKPRITKDAPIGHEYDRDDDGNYIYQFRDKKGRRKWCMKEVTDLSKKDLEWMHDEIDRIQNNYFEKYKIDDKVKRNDKRVTKDLREAGIKAAHIGKRDSVIHDDSYYEKLSQNISYDFVRNSLTETYEQIDKINDKEIESEQREIAADVYYEEAKLNTEYQEIKHSQLVNKTKNTAKKYVAEALPEKEIINRIVQRNQKEFEKISNRNHVFLSRFKGVLETGIAATVADINALKQKKALSLKEKAKLDLYKNNLKQMEILNRGLTGMISENKQNTRYDEIAQSTVKSWKTSSENEKLRLVKSVIGEKEFKVFCFVNNIDVESIKQKNTTSADGSFINSIKACPIPRIKIIYNNNETVSQNINRITDNIIENMENDLLSEMHQPPTNLDMLLVLATNPEKFLENISGNNSNKYYYPVFTKNYDPTQAQNYYLQLLPELEQKEYEYEQTRKTLNEKQYKVMFRYLEKIIILKYQSVYNQRYKHYLEGTGNIPDQDEIKEEIRKEFIFQTGNNRGKMNNAKILTEAKKLKINTLEAYKISLDLKENYNKYYVTQEPVEQKNVPGKTKISTKTKPINDTKSIPTTTEKTLPESTVNTEITNNKNAEKTNRNNQDPKINLRWNEKDNHKKSTMEITEEETYKNWNPGINKGK